MDFEPWPAALAAFLVVFQVVLVMIPGFYYTRKRVVDTSTRRKLSFISLNLLLPATNFYHIARTVSDSTIAQYLPFAANTVLSNVLGMIMGLLSNWVAGTPTTLRHHVVVAAGFGNLNSLPLLIATTICHRDSLPFQQVLGDSCSSVGYGYIAVGTAATQIFTYPIAIWLLKKRPERSPEPHAEVVVAAENMAMDGSHELLPSATLSVDLTQAATFMVDIAYKPPSVKAEAGGKAGVHHSPPLVADGAAAAATAVEPAAWEGQPINGRTTAASVGAVEQQPNLQSSAIYFSDSGSDSSIVASVESSNERLCSSSQQRIVGSSSSITTLAGPSGGIRPSRCGDSPPYRSASTGSSSNSTSPAGNHSSSSSSTAGGGGGSQAGQQDIELAAAAQQSPIPAHEVGSAEPAATPSEARPVPRMRTQVWHMVQQVWTFRVAQSQPPQPETRPPSQEQRWARAAWKFTNENVLPMPCIGAGLGLVVGVITPIKELLLPAQSAVLGVFMGSLFSIQAALIWCSSFVLGSTLSKGPGPGRLAIGWKPLFLVVLIRMLLLPMVGCVVVVGFIKLGWYTPLDPVYVYILLQQFCVPTANQMQNIASMAGNREQEMGSLIFWQYVAAFLAMPAWMVIFYWMMDAFSLYPGT